LESSDTVLDTALCEYSVDTPNPGWAEQDPHVWWQATVKTIRKEGLVLATIGTGGQLFTPIDNPRFDPQSRTHTFCHVLPDQC
jgi:sugar (pentulose or hexulose) kinase